MKFPKSISAWCMILFFLVFGINSFIAIPFGGVIAGVLALGVAIFTFIGK